MPQNNPDIYQKSANSAKRALDDGFSEKEVAEFLAKARNYNIDKARKESTDEEILYFLTTGNKFQDASKFKAATEGFKEGVKGMLSFAGGAGGSLQNFELDMVEKYIGKGPTTNLLRKITFPTMGEVGEVVEDVGIGPEFKKEELRREDRPYYVAGETVGASVVPMGATAGLAKAGLGQVGKKGVMAFAKSKPKEFLAREAAMASGAGLGAGIAEAVAPDNPWARLLGEVAGGGASPIATTLKYAAPFFKKGWSKVKMYFSKAGIEEEAAESLRKQLMATGESPDEIIKLLEASDEMGVDLFLSDKTGSKALQSLTHYIEKRSPKLKSLRQTKQEESFARLESAIKQVAKGGKPELIKRQAIKQRKKFEDIISIKIKRAEEAAAKASSDIGEEVPKNISALSTEASRLLDDAQKTARGMEKRLWSKIDKEIPIDTKNLEGATLDVSEKLLPRENLPTLVQDTITDLLDGGANVGEVLRFRSKLMNWSRKAAKDGDYDLANTYDTLSSGLLKDLDTLPDSVAKEAREFSRSMHDKFTRTYAADVIGTGKAGAPKVRPETVGDALLAGSSSKNQAMFKELREAAGFTSHEIGERMSLTQESILAAASKKTLNSDGTVNPTKLKTFMSKYANVLNDFPGLKSKLSTAEKAQNTFLKQVESGKSYQKAAARSRKTISELIETDDPVVAIGNVLSGKNSAKEYNRIARLAKSGGDDAILGLKTATLDNAINKSIDAKGNFDFNVFNKILKQGISKEHKGLLSLMIDNAVMSKTDASKLSTIVDRALKIQQNIHKHADVDELISPPNFLTDLVLSVAGARAGAMAAKGAGAGTSILAAGKGSAAAKNIFNKIPAAKTMKLLADASHDKELMIALLRKSKNHGEKLKFEKTLHAYLSASLVQFGDEMTQEKEKK